MTDDDPLDRDPMNDEPQPIDPLLHAVRKARETTDPCRMDVELAASVLEAALNELPEHFGPDAHAAYAFWLRNRIKGLRADRPFKRWLLTSSYQRCPELLMCELPP